MDFSDKKILVIGDIILDKYIEGEVKRISPEAPIPVLDKEKTYYRLGGATNVARNLRSLGANVWIIGRIGNDRYGKIVKELLTQEGIYCNLLIKSNEVPTIVKTRFVANNQQMLRVDVEKKKNVALKHQNTAYQALLGHMEYFDAIIVSDYDKGTAYPKLIRQLGKLRKEKFPNKVLTADTHKTDWSPFENFTCLTPNKEEFKQRWPTINFKNQSIQGYAHFARRTLISHNLDDLLLTLSGDGMLYVDKIGWKHFPAEKQNIVDVTGAGDTVIAVYTLMRISDYYYIFKDAVKLANKAAGIVVSKMGTATVSLEELNG